jgi:SNF2 family DNA or RNA helicase
VGYSQFVILLSSKGRTDDDLEHLQQWLLDPGPDIVIADEAHEIKNEKTLKTVLLSRIKTGSRIATTGSPLSNNLEEYWSMMNWIHPRFLGPLRDFREEYIEPIKDGLYSNSTAEQRRRSQWDLLRLKGVLKNKIHRKDLSVIQADLPPKTEFVIYVPLTALQRQLYAALVENADWKPRRNGNLFKWINILRLICNHPCALKVFLLVVKLIAAIHQ